MPSILKILAASVGGGIALGAGIRLGEAIATQIPVTGSETGSKLAERLDNLESRISALAPRPEIPPQDDPAQIKDVRDELRAWLEETVVQRLAEVEIRLKAESSRGQKEMLEAFASGVETRVIQRISRLEQEVAGQSAAMSELRECSLRTETSVQKLLGGLDRLIVKNSPPPVREMPAEGTPVGVSANRPAPSPAPPESGKTENGQKTDPLASYISAGKPRRWKLFG